MPNLQITDYQLGRNTNRPPSNTVVNFTFEVGWTQEELNSNAVYILRAYLIEWDDDKDQFVTNPNGTVVRGATRGNADEYWRIAWQEVRPNQGTEFPVESVGNYHEGEAGPGEYYIYGTIAPRNSHVNTAMTPDIVIELD